MSAGVQHARKGALDILCLEWVLGTELGFSVTVASALTHSAIPPAYGFSKIKLGIKLKAYMPARPVL